MFFTYRFRARCLVAATSALLLSPAPVYAGSYGSIPSQSIPSIPGPGLDQDCLRHQNRNVSDAEAARRVHACSKPYQPGPDGDARPKSRHQVNDDTKPVAHSTPAGKSQS